MAEAVAVLGLVSAIVQLADFTSKVIDRLNEFASATNDVPESFRSIKIQLPLVIDTLNRIQAQAQAGLINDATADVLRPVVDSSIDQVQSLTAVLDRFASTKGSSAVHRRLQALKSLPYDKEVQKSLKQLQNNIQLLSFHQTTQQTDISEQIRDGLSHLTLATPAVAADYAFGLQLGSAPQIESGAFVGRHLELKQLQQWLAPRCSPPSQNSVAVAAMGGVGKTQLSIAFAKSNHVRYSSVFWLDAKDENTLKQGFVTLSEAVLNLGQGSSAGSHVNEDQAVRQMRQWLSRQDNAKWLLIFDNYDDPNLPGARSSTGYDIRRYFPLTSQGSILITTRSHCLTFARQLSLSKLDDLNQSVAILASRSGRNLIDDPDAMRLAKRLDGLPLALTTAGAYLRQTAGNVCEYVEAYEEYWHELSDNAEELLEYEDRTLFSTWNLSLSRVRTQDAEAAEFLQLLAYFGNEDIRFELFQEAASHGLPWLIAFTQNKRRFERGLARLADYSLIETTAGSYRMHPCIHDWTLYALNRELNLQYYWIAVSCVASHVKVVLDKDFWLKTTRILPHALRFEHKHLRKLVGKQKLNETQAMNLYSLGYLWDSQGDGLRAQNMYQQSLAYYENALGPDHPLTLQVLKSLGLVYIDLGDPEKQVESEQMLQRVLEGEERIHGRDHPLTLSSVDNLSLVYCDQGKMVAAEQMCQRALLGKEKAFGPDHPSTLTTVHNLGLIYYRQGNMVAAEPMFQRALIGSEKVLGPGHPSAFSAATKLASLYCSQGNMIQAEQMYRSALFGQERVYGADNRSTLNTATNLGLVFCRQQKLLEAEQMLERVMEGFERTLGPEDPSTLQSRARFLRAVLRRQISTQTSESRDLSTETLFTLSRLIETALKSTAKGSVDTFTHLGKALLEISDERNATITFQQQIEPQNGLLMFKNTCCDGCDIMLTRTMRRFVCRRCWDIDLCGECHHRHLAGIQPLESCSDHAFLEVPPDVPPGSDPVWSPRTEERLAWLRTLQSEYEQR